MYTYIHSCVCVFWPAAFAAFDPTQKHLFEASKALCGHRVLKREKMSVRSSAGWVARPVVVAKVAGRLCHVCNSVCAYLIRSLAPAAHAE